MPNLSFTNFAGLQDTNPQLLRNQTYTFSDNVVWTHGKHTWRWGGDFRRIQLNTEASSNARGSFIFTGHTTRAMTLRTSLYEGQGKGQAAFCWIAPDRLRCSMGRITTTSMATIGIFMLQDEWKMRGNLTLNLGVRYEYVSPLDGREQSDREP